MCQIIILKLFRFILKTKVYQDWLIYLKKNMTTIYQIISQLNFVQNLDYINAFRQHLILNFLSLSSQRHNDIVS
jgi:hypothetical protein